MDELILVANVIQNWFMKDENGSIFGMMGGRRGWLGPPFYNFISKHEIIPYPLFHTLYSI
jgi:hypothetical protein